MNNKISKDVAMAELDKFLFEVKKINKEMLLSGAYGAYVKEYYIRLINDIAAGYFYFKDDKIVQRLDFPCGDETELSFSPRLKARDLSRQAAYAMNDVDGRQRETVAILTGHAAGIIQDMDSNDFERSKRVNEFYFLG